MRDKKSGRLFVLLLVVCSLCLLSGCHGREGLPAFTIPESLDASRTYEITFWAKNDTNKVQTAVYEQAIADFEKIYPNIHVNLRLYTDYGKIYNDVITNIATNTTPNVCITYPDHIATYLTGSNIVVPLEELLRDEHYGLHGSEVRFDGPTLEEMVPQYLEECAFGEHQYAIPYMRSTEVCYVNQTYVEKLGYTLPDVLTWDFIWEVSEAALRQDMEGNYAVNGQKILIPFLYKSTDNMMIQMLRQKEAGYSNEQGELLLFQDTTKELLLDIASHVQSGAFSTFKISGYPANFLNAGQCIFAVDSTAGATWMGTDAPLLDISEDKVVEFETAVRMVPQYDPENPQMISQGPSICIFNKEDSKEVLASWLFAQYLLSDQVQTGYAMTEGYVPVTVKAQQSKEYREYLDRCGEDSETHYQVKIEAAELLMEHVGDTFVTPVFNGSASLRDAAGQLVENTVKSVRRGEQVGDAYIETLYEDVKSLYRLDQLGGENRRGIQEKEELGELPGTAKGLLGALVGAWIGILGYVVWERKKRGKNRGKY